MSDNEEFEFYYDYLRAWVFYELSVVHQPLHHIWNVGAA